MTIGEAWNLDDPLKPWALFDSDARIRIPIGLNGWLEEIGATYGDHQVIVAAPLECVDKGTYATDAAGTIKPDMRLAVAAAFVSGRKYPFTVRVIGADGTTRDDRTLWLKVVSR